MGATNPLEWRYVLLQVGSKQAGEGKKEGSGRCWGGPQRHAVWAEKGRRTRSQQQQRIP